MPIKYLFFAVFLTSVSYATCDPSLAPTYTTRAGFQKPQINSCSWGAATNANWSIVDSSVSILAGTNTFTGANTFTGLSWNFPTPNLTVDRIATKLGGTAGGSNSVSIGNSSLNLFKTSGYSGRPNVAIGPNALANFVDGGNTSQTGGQTAIGSSALASSTGTANTAIGDFAGTYLTYGNWNEFLGYLSGVALNGNGFVHGENNLFIGQFSGPTSTTPYISNSGAIGYASKVGQSNSLSLGCNATDCAGGGYSTFKVGIGTDTPSEVLDIVGNFKIEGTGNGIKFADGSLMTGTTTFIDNTSSLQSGATFYVSSGTVKTELDVLGNANFGASKTMVWDNTNGVLRLGGGAFDTSSWMTINQGSSLSAISIRGSGAESILITTNTTIDVLPIVAQNSVDQMTMTLDLTSRSGLLINSLPVAGPDSTFIPLTLKAQDTSSTVNSESIIIKSQGVSISSTTTFDQVLISTSGHFITNAGTTPVISSCGTTPNGSVVGNDNEGTITVGGGAVTACTLTFAKTWGVAPVCVITDNSTATTGDISSVSATAFTSSFSISIGGGTIWYRCGCSGASCR